jgi:hypothetical protein
MQFENPEYIRDNLFHHLQGYDVWWRSCAGDDNGYIVLFADGSSFHTYRYPPDISWE